MNQRELSRYGVVKVTTCSPGQLLVMLYDALFRFLREGAVAMEVKDRAKANERITRSLAILEQLLLGLNRDALPTLCDKLSPLYGFCMTHITAANLHQDPTKLTDVIRILSPLREAWGDAVAQVTREVAPSTRDSAQVETRVAIAR
jgi:flagellar protein FliS